MCKTELGYVARINSQFDRRGVKIVDLPVDPAGETSSGPKTEAQPILVTGAATVHLQPQSQT